MKTPRIRLPAMAAVLAALAVGQPALAGVPTSPASLNPQQQASLNAVLNSVSEEAVTAQRLHCFFGKEPDRVAEARRAGQTFRLDAADMCVAVLVRSARDGRLFDLYHTLLRETGGNQALAEQMPTLVGQAALRGDETMSLGNGKTIDVAPTLAFDAGFTLAYLHKDARKANADPAKLKTVAESCFGVKTEAGSCFAAGYAEGGKALTMEPMALFSQ